MKPITACRCVLVVPRVLAFAGLVLAGLVLAGLVLVRPGFAEEPTIGYVKTMSGGATVTRDGVTSPLQQATPIFEKDRVETGREDRALFGALRATINGIALGLQATG